VELARLLAVQGKKNEAEKHYQEALRLMKSQNPR
jgi:predicted negative regulator of RcsB-dependent stress response